jgi:hypothetical protein
VSSQLEQVARDLYEHKCSPESYTPRPTWSQLGDVTKGVWRDYAVRKLAGAKDWWSIQATFIKAVSAPGIRGAPQECLNMSLNHKKVAEQLDVISEAFTALAGTFRHGGSAGADSSVDGEAAKPVRASKPAAGKSKAKEASELTIDDVRTKLKELVEAKGKEKMVEALESVGAGKLADVDESQYQELVDKAQEFIDEEDEPAPKAKPAAKKTTKKAGPTLDEVNEAAKALITADKPAYLKLTKKLGKPSEMDEADYAAAIEAYMEAMPSEEAEDDLL